MVKANRSSGSEDLLHTLALGGPPEPSQDRCESSTVSVLRASARVSNSGEIPPTPLPPHTPLPPSDPTPMWLPEVRRLALRHPWQPRRRQRRRPRRPAVAQGTKSSQRYFLACALESRPGCDGTGPDRRSREGAFRGPWWAFHLTGMNLKVVRSRSRGVS